MQSVSGRDMEVARDVRGTWVSPRPWRRSRMLGVGVEGKEEGVGAGVIERVMWEGKSEA